MSVEKSVADKSNQDLQLIYTLCCDDVRLEMGNKLSFMGVFQNIMVQQLPVSLLKFAIVNHWQGSGAYMSEVRVMSPNKDYAVVVSQPTRFEIAAGGTADNISFFVNVVLNEPGVYWIQTLVNSTLFHEQPLTVTGAGQTSFPAGESEIVN